MEIFKRGVTGAAVGALKKVPKKLGTSVSDLDPTKVRRADTSATEALVDQAKTKSEELFNKPVERFTPTAIRPGVGTVTNVQAATVGPIAGRENFMRALAQSQGMVNNAGQIDPRMQQFLEQSLGQTGNTNQALSLLQQAAQGSAPSAAMGVMQAGTDDAIRAQMAAGASGGFNPSALRGAQNQGAMLQQQAINQGAALRAQEMAQARQAYGQLGLSADQAQAQNYANAAGLQLNASQFQDQARQAAMNSFLSANQNLYGMDQNTAFQNAMFAQQSGLANAGAANDMSRFNIGNVLSADQFNQQLNQNAFNQYQAAQQGYAGLGASMFGQALGGQQTLTALEQARQNAISEQRAKMAAAGIQAAGTVAAEMAKSSGQGAQSAGVAAAAMSDRKQKKNIKVNKSTQAFLNALTDNEYEYRDTSLLGTQSGKNYGPMAQDLEKSDMGKTIVKQTANGKMVDTSRGFLLALSGLANLNTRLSALEGN